MPPGPGASPHPEGPRTRFPGLSRATVASTVDSKATDADKAELAAKKQACDALCNRDVSSGDTYYAGNKCVAPCRPRASRCAFNERQAASERPGAPPGRLALTTALCWPTHSPHRYVFCDTYINVKSAREYEFSDVVKLGQSAALGRAAGGPSGPR